MTNITKNLDLKPSTVSNTSGIDKVTKHFDYHISVCKIKEVYSEILREDNFRFKMVFEIKLKIMFHVGCHPCKHPKRNYKGSFEISTNTFNHSFKESTFPDELKQPDAILVFNIKHNFYKNTFFPSTIIGWDNLDPNLRNSENVDIFKNNILKFIKPKPNNFFTCCNLKGIRLITRLRLELSHLR